MCISVVAEQWGQGFHLESNGDKECVWRKGRGLEKAETEQWDWQVEGRQGNKGEGK